MAKNNIEIIYEDQHIIAVNKPAGISVTHDRTGKDSIIEYIRREQPTLKIVYRLDKDTSGIMSLQKIPTDKENGQNILKKAKSEK